MAHLYKETPLHKKANPYVKDIFNLFLCDMANANFAIIIVMLKLIPELQTYNENKVLDYKATTTKNPTKLQQTNPVQAWATLGS